MSSTWWVVCGVAVLYVAIVRLLRFRRRDLIAGIDVSTPEGQHAAANQLLFYEMPFMGRVASFLGFFYTFAVPSMSAVLDANAQFRAHGLKRIDDTYLLLSELAEHGLDSERGSLAVKRINFIHSHYSIRNDDALYTVAVFLLHPGHWFSRFGWRAYTPQERFALHAIWRRNATAFGVRDLPDTYEALEEWCDKYERERFKYAACNQSVSEALFDSLARSCPTQPLQWLAGHALRWTALSLVSPAVVAALGYTRPPRLWSALVRCVCWLHGWVLTRWLLPPRPDWLPYRITRPNKDARGNYHAVGAITSTYQRDGYQIARLGPSSVKADVVAPLFTADNPNRKLV